MKTVFETSLWTGDWLFLIPVVIAVAAWAILGWRYKTGKNTDVKFTLAAAFLTLIAVLIIADNVKAYNQVLTAYRRGDCRIVEGEVTDFVPAASKHNPYEEFTVDGVTFNLGNSGGRQYFGYAKTSAFGGAITENGMYVKIWYILYEGTNVIVRLDVADIPE